MLGGAAGRCRGPGGGAGWRRAGAGPALGLGRSWRGREAETGHGSGRSSVRSPRGVWSSCLGSVAVKQIGLELSG